MPTYISLFSWTDQGIRNVRDTLERVDRASELAEEKYGVKLGQIYWTVGPYDLVSVFEAPDEQSVTAFLLELGSVGNVRSTTLRAYDREEMSGILERLG
ncbi:MAG: GYD domain-containing protein [Actinomycetota bacterium]|nr:GYD domain-containing protein [Actinomycetota bacterium]